jgi:hypothetical protein
MLSEQKETESGLGDLIKTISEETLKIEKEELSCQK